MLSSLLGEVLKGEIRLSVLESLASIRGCVLAKLEDGTGKTRRCKPRPRAWSSTISIYTYFETQRWVYEWIGTAAWVSSLDWG